jgi:hypothetical protein
MPAGNPLYQMLEAKLAMYLDFPSNMEPGVRPWCRTNLLTLLSHEEQVFVTCADDIELFDGDGDLTFTKPGFTALGHPSSLEIGMLSGACFTVLCLLLSGDTNNCSSKVHHACMQVQPTVSLCSARQAEQQLHSVLPLAKRQGYWLLCRLFGSSLTCK